MYAKGKDHFKSREKDLKMINCKKTNTAQGCLPENWAKNHTREMWLEYQVFKYPQNNLKLITHSIYIFPDDKISKKVTIRVRIPGQQAQGPVVNSHEAPVKTKQVWHQLVISGLGGRTGGAPAGAGQSA